MGVAAIGHVFDSVSLRLCVFLSLSLSLSLYHSLLRRRRCPPSHPTPPTYAHPRSYTRVAYMSHPCHIEFTLVPEAKQVKKAAEDATKQQLVKRRVTAKQRMLARA